jgi:hypothetical protein
MKTILLFFCLLSTLISFSQNRFTDTSATCIAFWKNKASRVYQVKHSKEKFELSTLKTSTEATFEAHLKIIDSTASGFTIEWVYKNFKTAGAPEQLLNSICAIMENIKIVYKTDEVGTFTELINWEEVRDFSISSYEKALANKPKTSDFIAALNQIKAIFQSKENTEALLIKEIQFFHSPFGMEYNKRGTIVEMELPNVTGGAPIPASLIMKLDEINVHDDLCKISLNQTIDKGKAGAVISDILKKLSPSPLKDEAEMKRQVKELEISDVNQYTYSLSSGWISRIFYERTSNIGSLKQVETYLITEKK